MIDLGRLLEGISADAPCGPDLGYTDVKALSAAAQSGVRSRMVGDAVEVATDWRAVGRQATELLSRTKDLRVAVLLLKSSLHTEGLVGLASAIELIRGLLERHWQGLHPLDEDDPNNPDMRTNALRELCDHDSVLTPVRKTALVSLPALGKFGLRDFALASGELKLPAGSSEKPPTMDVIESAFRNCKLEDLQATAAAVKASIEHLKAIETYVTAQVGVDSALRLNELIEALQQMERILGPRIAARGNGSAQGEAQVEAAGNGAETTSAAEGRVAVGQVTSREDVIRLLDKICEYYERQEPSSPIPVLLRRCKRLVPMSFNDIIKDLIPDGISQFETIRGPESNETA